MLQAISDYRSNSLGLRQLISNLEGLHKLLEDASENWDSSFYQFWMPLEEVYAVALDRSKGANDEDSGIVINKPLGKLEALIKTNWRGRLSCEAPSFTLR